MLFQGGFILKNKKGLTPLAFLAIVILLFILVFYLGNEYAKDLTFCSKNPQYCECYLDVKEEDWNRNMGYTIWEDGESNTRENGDKVPKEYCFGKGENFKDTEIFDFKKKNE